MKCAVAVFAKTIGLSPVKTRLAEAVGVEAAETFYRLSVECISAVLSNASTTCPELRPHWVLGEEEAPSLEQWRAYPALWTGEGGLGTRLANVSEALFETHDAVMFIGTDSPQLSQLVLTQALTKLSAFGEDCVAGPAEDGGFYLFGSSKPIARTIWEAVEYSRSTTLQDLQSRIEANQRHVHHLAVEQDVDLMEDLLVLRENLKQSAVRLLPQQKKLLSWLEDNFPE